MEASALAEFEMAVLCAFQYAGASAADQQAQATKRQAEEFCAAIKARADGWRFALELFERSEHQEVKFYALQFLQVCSDSLNDCSPHLKRTDKNT
jgi:hypothetical protein